MKNIEKLLLTGCGYSVLILTIFYIFAALTGFSAPAIAPGRFALILFFGMIISFAELMYNCLKIKKSLRGIIHYGVLLVAFCVIFIISGNIISGKAAAVFVAVVVYTLLYFTMWLIIHFVRKAINAADNKIDKKIKPKQKKGKEYKSLYNNDK